MSNIAQRGRHGKKWVTVNYQNKERAREKNGGAMPDTQALYTSPFPGHDEWSGSNLPDILFYIFPPPCKYAKLPIKMLFDNGQPVRGPDGSHLKDFDHILPRHISLDVPGWLVEAWRRMDTRIGYADILARQEGDEAFGLIKASKNALQNRCYREARAILRNWLEYNRRGEPHRREVERIEQLSYENFQYNTVLQRSACDPNRLGKYKLERRHEDGMYYAVPFTVTYDNCSETTFPLNHFMLTPEPHVMDSAMMAAWELSLILTERAEWHGLDHWSKLSKTCLPVTWSDRTKEKNRIKPRKTYDGGCKVCTWDPSKFVPLDLGLGTDWFILNEKGVKRNRVDDGESEKAAKSRKTNKEVSGDPLSEAVQSPPVITQFDTDETVEVVQPRQITWQALTPKTKAQPKSRKGRQVKDVNAIVDPTLMESQEKIQDKALKSKNLHLESASRVDDDAVNGGEGSENSQNEEMYRDEELEGTPVQGGTSSSNDTMDSERFGNYSSHFPLGALENAADEVDSLFSPENSMFRQPQAAATGTYILDSQDIFSPDNVDTAVNILNSSQRQNNFLAINKKNGFGLTSKQNDSVAIKKHIENGNATAGHWHSDFLGPQISPFKLPSASEWSLGSHVDDMQLNLYPMLRDKGMANHPASFADSLKQNTFEANRNSFNLSTPGSSSKSMNSFPGSLNRISPLAKGVRTASSSFSSNSDFGYSSVGQHNPSLADFQSQAASGNRRYMSQPSTPVENFPRSATWPQIASASPFQDDRDKSNHWSYGIPSFGDEDVINAGMMFNGVTKALSNVNFGDLLDANFGSDALLPGGHSHFSIGTHNTSGHHGDVNKTNGAEITTEAHDSCLIDAKLLVSPLNDMPMLEFDGNPDEPIFHNESIFEGY